MSKNSEVLTEIENGQLSLRKIAEKHEIGMSKVKTLNAKGKWYVDLLTGEMDVSIKDITDAQQQFYILYKYMLAHENVCKPMTKEEELTYSKSLIARISKYLDVNDRTAYRWKKDKQYLVKEEYISQEVKRYITTQYLLAQKDIMMEFYDSDTLYPKGFKLNYIDYTVKDGFAYYINQQVSRYYHSDLNERDFIHMCLKVMEEENVAPFVIRLSAILGIQLCGWVRMMEEQGYEYEECMQCLRSYERFTKDKEKYEGRLVPPRVIYYETRGFQMLPEEIQWNLIKMKEDGEVAGTFDYNPMMWEIKKLEYG